MGINNKEYIYSINNFKDQKVVEGKTAIAMRLMELLMMNPGQDPLHPDMGVGLKNYRYGVDSMDDFRNRIQNQINTYLPMYNDVSVALIRTEDKLLNIEIYVGDMIFVYDSKNAPIPISLDDVKNGV